MTDETYTAPRRGRPPMSREDVTTQDAAAEQVPGGSPVAAKSRRKRDPVGGFKQRLDAPQRAGYQRRWVNDDGVRPELLHTDLAYDFVIEPNTDTHGQGTRVSRVVGRKASGEPQYAYLMETPVEEYAVGVAEKEDRLKPFEEAIRSNQDTTGALKQAEMYQPRAGSSLKRS